MKNKKEREHYENVSFNMLELCAIKVHHTGVFNGVCNADVADLVQRECVAARSQILEKVKGLIRLELLHVDGAYADGMADALDIVSSLMLKTSEE